MDNNYSTFIGTWESTQFNFNQTLRVVFWKENRVKLTTKENSFMDRILGRFLILQNARTINETVVCNSVKYYPQNNVTSEWILIGYAVSTAGFGAYFEGNCAVNGILTGGLSFRVLNINFSPLQAEWEIKHGQLYDNEEFAVPTNIILTKKLE